MTTFIFYARRRRHPRYGRDWISDVCSSDLEKTAFTAYSAEYRQYRGYDATLQTGPYNFGDPARPDWAERYPYQDGLLVTYRSEERRVGKECRSRWSPYH